jgi:hypothetical protein
MPTALWNRNDSSAHILFGNAFLTAIADNADNGSHMVRANQSRGGGKWYWEIIWFGQNSFINVLNTFGIQDISVAVDGFGVGNAGTSCGWQNALAQQVILGSNFTTIGVVGTFPDGTYGVAWDADAGKIWFTNNSGGYLSAGNPATGANPAGTQTGGTKTLFPAVAFAKSGDPSAGQATANFAGPFKYAIPAGFLPFDQPDVFGPIGIASSEW